MAKSVPVLVAAVDELLLAGRRPSDAARLREICGMLGVDRPELWEDPSFLVLLAIALSPAEAINYEALDPRPRWTYIRGYLRSVVDLGEDKLERLARRLAHILDDYDRERFRLNDDLDRLLARDRR